MKYLLFCVGVIVGIIISPFITDSGFFQWLIKIGFGILGYNIPLFISYCHMSPKQLLAFHGENPPLAKSKSKGELATFVHQLMKGGLVTEYVPEIMTVCVNEPLWGELSNKEKICFSKIYFQFFSLISEESGDELTISSKETQLAAYSPSKGLLEEPHRYQEEGAEWCRRGAELGDAEAQYNLGRYYYLGKGVPHDYKEAEKWCRLAAEQGLAEAQCNMGKVYATGRGVTQDYKESIRWYRLAAEQGSAEAQLSLGSSFALGTGIPQDYNEAMKWYRLAAEQGVIQAQTRLGAAYGKGQGVPKSYSQAYAWFDISAKQGDERAIEFRAIALKEMTPEQIKEGQRLSREYAEKFIKK